MPENPVGSVPDFGLKIEPITPAYDPKLAIESLQSVVHTQKEAVRASAEALAKNTVIQQQTLDAVTTLQDNTLKAFENRQRIESIGVDNPVIKLLELFNPDWNAKTQELQLEINAAKTQQITTRAQAQQAINNQLPALKEAEARLAETEFSNQMRVFDITAKVQGMEIDAARLANERVRLNIDLSQEQRQQIDMTIDTLTVEEAQAALREAKKGQGPFVNLKGLLQNHIDRENKSQIELDQAAFNLKKGREDQAEENLNRFVSYMTTAQLDTAIEASGGNAFVDLGNGVQLPVVTLIEQRLKTGEAEMAVTKTILAERSEEVNDLLSTVVNSTAALSQAFPAAAKLLAGVTRVAQETDGNDPSALRRAKVFFEGVQTQITKIGKAHADTYQSPEAKAGIEEYVANGRPSLNGAVAVTTEKIGSYSAMQLSKFPNAWARYNQKLSERVSQLNLEGAPTVDTDSSNPNDMMIMMRWMTMNPNKKVADIKAELAVDENLKRAAQGEIETVLYANTVDYVVSDLVKGPVKGIWASINETNDQIATNGALDPLKLTQYLARQSVLTGGKVDYNKVFVDALRTHAVNYDSSKADPGITMEDQFFMTNIFGQDPRRMITHSFASRMAQNAQIETKNMRELIDRDLSGETERKAIAGMPEQILSDPSAVQQILSRVPSATGVGTVLEIKALYGGTPVYGTMNAMSGGVPGLR